ncbi:MAG TPA: aspartate--tRNA ligase, partial [Candidatus Syntrophosphaera sp.]|nr:aspartate--tRNA ligase [Candidatus Syntrophosphaera sp.]
MLDNLNKLQRSHYCGELGIGQIGNRVTVMGWVNKRRDLGGLIFIDLRDVKGIVQAVFRPESTGVFAKAEKLRNEYVAAVTGVVAAREPANVNVNLPTGGIEIIAEDLNLLNDCQPLPIQLTEVALADEDLRLAHRYLDLRRPALQQVILLRHRVVKAIRDFLCGEGFYEIETPILMKSTPEGARDYLVPSRVHPGKFYALPQSPQMFKQLLMIGGFDRYFQIARCFRDEDLRADRQPEFTQLDLEMSFATQEQIFDLLERLLACLFSQIMGREIRLPFPRLSYQEAMDRFGCDKPDLRFGLELFDLSEGLRDSQFQVFREALDAGGVIKALAIPGGANYSRKRQDELVELARHQGGKGLAFAKVTGSGLEGGISKFLSPAESDYVVRSSSALPGDLLAISAAGFDLVSKILAAVRVEVARQDGLIPADQYAFAWITDFPLFLYNAEE